MLFVPGDFGVIGGHQRRALIPIRHADGDAIGFGRRSQALARSGLRQLEGELEDAIDATPGEHRLLQHELVFGAFEHLAADRRVLALGVFAYHHKVDIARLAPRQWARHTGEQAHWTNVHVLVEVAAEFEQRSP